MNIEESIIEFKKMIERDKDTLRYWKSDTFGHYDEPIKKLEKDVLISETLLTAYEKEKEKNKKYIVQLTDKQYRKLVDIIRAKISKEWKDKIKSKIEEYKKQQKEEPDAYLCIKVLQSLLEKEGE